MCSLKPEWVPVLEFYYRLVCQIINVRDLAVPGARTHTRASEGRSEDVWMLDTILSCAARLLAITSHIHSITRSTSANSAYVVRHQNMVSYRYLFLVYLVFLQFSYSFKR